MDVNVVAVVLAALSSMIIGFVWYHPSIFGNTWVKLVGKSDLQKGKKEQMYILLFGSAVIMSYVLAVFINYMKATTLTEGAVAGFLAWTGFVATTSGIRTLFENRSGKLYILNNAYQLIALVVMGILLTLWR